MSQQRYPAKWIEKFLEIFLKERFADESIGDLYEWYELKQDSFTTIRFYFYYLLTIFKTLKLYKLKNLRSLFITLTELIMISNNLKIGVRSLINQRFFTLINIIGLTISLTSFLLIYAYVNFESSFDNYHSKADQTYRVLWQQKQSGDLSRPTPTPLVKALSTAFPGTIEFARLGQDPVFIEANEQKYYEEEFYWADAMLFSIFDMPFLYGNASQALKEPNTLVITQAISEKYFGENVNPVGKILPVKIYDGNTELSMRIDGVLKSLPANSDIKFDMLGSISNALSLYSQFENSWGFQWLDTYAHIPARSDYEQIVSQLPDFTSKLEERGYSTNRTFYLQPLEKMHLHSREITGAGIDGNINYVRTFIVIGVFILLIALINYLNLMGVRVNKRRMEVNVRKVLGANRSQLLSQFLTESNLTIFISFFLAILITFLLWPAFKGFLGKEIPIEVILNWKTGSILFLIVFIAGTLSGIYPAWILSSSKLENAIGQHNRIVRRNWLQKMLVTVQFIVAVFLVITTTVIFAQINFMSNKSLGFDEGQLISIKVEDRELQSKIELIKQEMGSLAGIEDITTSSESLPSAMQNTWELSWMTENGEQIAGVDIVSVDKNFFGALKIFIQKGENFIKSYQSDSARSIVINQAAAKMLQVADPIGMKVTIGGTERIIVGLVNDYHYNSLKSKVEPLVFMISGRGNRLNRDNIIVRLKKEQIVQTIGSLDQVWQKFSKRDFFSFHFVDKSFQDIYESERSFLELFTIFSILSILISCLGLYGIVLFATEEKSKEISIRKVLGSSIIQIVLLISKNFLILVLIGFILGAPLAIYFSQDWLSQYEYRIAIDVVMILFAGLFVLLISMLTVGLKTFKAAMANPAKYLRNE